MLQSGIVKEIHCSKQQAEVEITRSSACGDNCASCGLCPGQTARVFAVNDINACVGDRVAIEMSDKNVLGAAFLVYIVPIIALIAGYLLGDILFKSEPLGVLTGIIFMAVTFIVIMRIDRKNKRKYTPRIVQIITEGEKQ